MLERTFHEAAVCSHDDHSAAAAEMGLNDPATTWAMIDHHTAGMNRSHTAVGTEPRFCTAARPEARQLALVSRVEFAAIRGFVDGTTPVVALRYRAVRRSERLDLPLLGCGMLWLRRGMLLWRGLPSFGCGLALLRCGLPFLRRGLPLLRRGMLWLRCGVLRLRRGMLWLRRRLPSFGRGLPLLRRGMLWLRRGVLWLRRGVLWLRRRLPSFGRGLPSFGRGLPFLRRGVLRLRLLLLLLLIVLSPGRS
ncbi:MAG: hypothetical protein ABSA52_00820 [Candidatus Binatia bacterium]